MTIYAPNYPANWTPLANDAADASFRGNPMARFYKGGRADTKPISVRIPKPPAPYAKGGLANEAKQVAQAGVGGDEMIIHINRQEFEELKKHWGDPTINPHTGMPQFTPFWKQSWFAPVAALAGAALMATGVGAPIGGALLGGLGAGETAAATLGGLTGIDALGSATVGSLLGNTLIGGGVGALTGGAKGALTGGVLAGLGTIGSSALGNWLGGGANTSGSDGSSSSPEFSTSGYEAAGSPLPTPRPTGSDLSAIGGLAGGSDGTAASSSGSGLGSNLMSTLSKPSVLIPAALLGAAAFGGGSPKTLPSGSTTPNYIDPNMTKRLETAPLNRTRLAGPDNYYTYGYGPATRYYSPETDQQNQPTVQAAHGGPLSHYVQGGGTGRSDSINARLSDGEYVIDAETVAMLGDGSSKAGAKKLDQFRANIRKQKGKALAKGKFSPDAKRPEEYI